MNLVQINERLKDLPMQVIQQYANGMNPEVPPYLALGELQRREIAQKQMATAQGGAQGPQPSVKEQVEQKAGLMAAQAMQQQQAMQQMAQPRGPMPAPAGVPQPEAQPQPPMMAARGGLARAPVRFDFQHGGIVAFSGKEGSQVKEETEQEKKERIAKELQEYMRKNNGELPAGLKAAYAGLDVISLPGRALMGMANTGVVRPLRAMGADIPYIPESMFLGDSSSMTPAYDELRRAEDIYRADQERDKNMRAVRNQGENMRPTMQNDPRIIGATPPDETVAPTKAKPAAPIADLKTLNNAQKQQQGPRPAPAAAAPQAAPGGQESELSRLAMEALRNPAKAMTPEEALAREGKLAAGYGLDKQFGEEERGLLAAMKQRQAQYAAGRPMSELNAVLRGFGQVYGGAGAAGERASQETFNADMAHQREMLNAINALNKTNLETGRERYKTSGALFGKDQESTAAANRERMQSLGQMSTAEANRKTQERGQDIQKEVAQINARANAAGRPFNIVETQYNLLKTGDPKKDAELLQKLSAQYAEGRKPGLDLEAVKKFENLPGVQMDINKLKALRGSSNPSSKTLGEIKRLEDTLAAQARANGIDPAQLGLGGGNAVSPGVNSALFNKADAILSGGK